MSSNEIKSTLSQRGAEYGSFEKVADTTLGLLKALKKGNSFKKMSKADKVALFMVCNKLSRLVNGKKKDDTLLDIQGYIQLMRESNKKDLQ